MSASVQRESPYSAGNHSYGGGSVEPFLEFHGAVETLGHEVYDLAGAQEEHLLEPWQ